MNTVIGIGSVVAGALSWTPFEYLLHRANHVLRGKIGPSREHLGHHVKPDTFIPWWKKGIFFLLLLAGANAISRLFALGLGLAYLAYEWLHRDAHVNPPRTRYGALVRERHFRHHFVNAQMNYGVTNGFFDRAFHTDLPMESIPVPRQMTSGLPWLIDENGEVRPAYRDRYHLVH